MRITREIVERVLSHLGEWYEDDFPGLSERFERDLEKQVRELETADYVMLDMESANGDGELPTEAYARHTDPDTSKRAAAKLTPRSLASIGGALLRVYPTPMEIASGTRPPMNSVEAVDAARKLPWPKRKNGKPPRDDAIRPRIKPMKNSGLLWVVDVVKREDGEDCERCALTNKGLARRQKLEKKQSAPV